MGSKAMFEALNRRLAEVKERVRRRQRLARLLKRAEEELARQRERGRRLDERLRKERTDVERLEGLSLTGLFYTVLGSKEQQLEKERQEYLVAKLQYDECREAVQALEREVEDLRRDLTALGDPEAEYRSLLARKEQLLQQTSGEAARRLLSLAEEEGEVQAEIKELQEAIAAGDEALRHLRKMSDALQGAMYWGTWDILGGRWAATAFKHSRMDDARAAAHRAQQALRRWERELDDVDLAGTELEVDMDSLTRFADYFFDGLIVDWVVQTRIQRSLENVLRVQRRVESVMDRLHERLGVARRRLKGIEEARVRLIEEV
jgi:hypothetical protein